MILLLSFITHMDCSWQNVKHVKKKLKLIWKRRMKLVSSVWSMHKWTLWLIYNLGTSEEVARYTKRTVRVTKEHNDECKRLLKLMGIPYVEASPHFHDYHQWLTRCIGSMWSWSTMCCTGQSQYCICCCIRRYGYFNFWITTLITPFDIFGATQDAHWWSTFG